MQPSSMYYWTNVLRKTSSKAINSTIPYSPCGQRNNSKFNLSSEGTFEEKEEDNVKHFSENKSLKSPTRRIRQRLNRQQ